MHAWRGSLATPSMARGGLRKGPDPLVHWTKVQSELAYILIQNVKGVRWPPPRSSVFDKNGKGVANEPLAVEGVAFETPKSEQ
jgi:hypothetical protein